MKIIAASDSFKESLTSEKIAEIIAQSAAENLRNACVVPFFMADGGEGTLSALAGGGAFKPVKIQTVNSLKEPVSVYYGEGANHTAVIETAQASGLAGIEKSRRNPLYTTSYGTGESILKAVEKGAAHIYLCLGGSATNDGGAGALSAMGAKYYNRNGEPVNKFTAGKDLEEIYTADFTALKNTFKNVSFTLLCDVKNPLLGKNGATYTFGPQKGGGQSELDRLEKGMENFARVIKKETGNNPEAAEGGGAAGGIAAAFSAVFGGEIKSGAETVLDLAGFDKLLTGADLVITGEGRCDGQSVNGKAVSAVGKRCRKYNVPAVVIAGSLAEGYEKLCGCGITAAFSLIDSPCSLETALRDAERLYRQTADNLFRLIDKIKSGE